MSDAGKGDNTAKRTNFKKFSEGWEKIKWSDSPSSSTNTELPQDIKEQLEEIGDKIEYQAELKSGMFFEWYPGLTGTWEGDKVRWKLLRKDT